MKVISQLKKSLHCDFFSCFFREKRRKLNGRNEKFIACRILKMRISHSVASMCAPPKIFYLYKWLKEKCFKSKRDWMFGNLALVFYDYSRDFYLPSSPLISLLLIIYDALNFYFSHFFRGFLLFFGMKFILLWQVQQFCVCWNVFKCNHCKIIILKQKWKII